MNHVLETSIFDEITNARNEATLNVIDALILEYDKLDMITQMSENSTEFQIVQESFTKPDKHEGTLTKIALAVPRAIYALIKAIVDGFKRAFGNKNRVSVETIEHASKVVENLTGNEEVMKLACGAVVGTVSAVGLFLKTRYNRAKKKITDTVNERRERQETIAQVRHTFESKKQAAKESIKDMVGLYVNEKNEVGLILFTDLDELREKAVSTYLKAIEGQVATLCSTASHYQSKSKFNANLDKGMFDIENNFTLFTYMIPDTINPKDYTYAEYRAAVIKFGETKFTETIKKSLERINALIVSAYKGFESSSKKGDEKEEKLEKQANKNYGEEIVRIVGERIKFMQQWIIDLDKFIETAITEYNKTMKAKVAKLEPNIKMSDWTKEEWSKDKAAKDAERNKKNEESKKEDSEEEPEKKEEEKKDSSENEEKEEK